MIKQTLREYIKDYVQSKEIQKPNSKKTKTKTLNIYVDIDKNKTNKMTLRCLLTTLSIDTKGIFSEIACTKFILDSL